MKDYILNNVSMKDILYRYGIKTHKDMFSCPFHKDKKPSAKAYENSFYCFSCGLGGDIIKFVQKYFNLSFKEAMQKINEDFNLSLNNNIKIDYNKINDIKKQKEEKEKYKNDLWVQFNNNYRKIDLLQKERVFLMSTINLNNIDTMLQFECELRDIQWNTELEIEDIEKKMARIN